MVKKNTGISYEELVQEIYQALLDGSSDKDKIESTLVQHNVVLQGKSGTSHQIDVYWEFEIAGIKYATIVEVKDLKLCRCHCFTGGFQSFPSTVGA